jgi:hypothetical protein
MTDTFAFGRGLSDFEWAPPLPVLCWVWCVGICLWGRGASSVCPGMHAWQIKAGTGTHTF